MLEGMGHEVIVAINGVVATNVLATNVKFDITLLDWNMPEMNGIDFLNSLNKDFSKSGKVLMMTTETDFNKIQQAISAGALEYIMKPFDEDILLKKINLVKDKD